MPWAELLRLYRDLDGTVITIGSDAHAPGQLGAGVQQAQQQLRETRFRYFCTFQEMRPVFHRL